MRYSGKDRAAGRRAGRVRAASLTGICGLLLAGMAHAEPCTFDTVEDGVWRLLEDCETTSTILVPDGVTLAGDRHRITAVEETPGDWRGAIIQADGASANVQDLVLTAENLACVCQEGTDRLQGIRFESATGNIRRNLLVDINKGDCGCQEGSGIVVSNPPFDGSGDAHAAAPDVFVTANQLRDYQKAGIVVSGDVRAAIGNNLVRGSGTNETIGQNGIQVGFGASAKIVGNTVLDHRFRGSALATGILVFESDRIEIVRNDLANNETGIAIEAWCWYTPSADNNRIAQNSIDGANVAVSITAMAFDAPFSNCDATADGNDVVNNTLATSEGEAVATIFAGVECDGCGWLPQARGNRVRANRTNGFDYEVIEGSAVDPAKAREARSQPYWP